MTGQRWGRSAVRLAWSVRAAVRAWGGEADYARYLKRCAAAGEAPLGRGAYFAQRCEQRYRCRERCC